MKGQPFFFDENIFDEDDPRQDVHEDIVQKPEFTQDQLQAAKESAYQEGMRAGFAQSEGGLTQKMLEVLNLTHNQIETLFVAESERCARYEAETVALTYAVFKKSFPYVLDRCGAEEIKTALAHTLQDYKDMPKLRVHCAPDMVQPLQDFVTKNLPDMANNVSFQPDPSFVNTRCQILWADGGLILNKREITQKISAIMEQTLAEHGIHSHDDYGHREEDLPDTDAKDTARNDF